MDVLIRIKRAVAAGNVIFTEKAEVELEADGLRKLDAIEAILNAAVIYKTLRSTSPRRARRDEKLYVIQSTNFDGLYIYTKGKLVRREDRYVFYVLVSSKRTYRP